MNELQFFFTIAVMLPALYLTMKFIVWISEKIESKNEKK
tara:strand:+ start:138 stop:254 length:117 start_codon:yes stop_codon:yes gene_type:complete